MENMDLVINNLKELNYRFVIFEFNAYQFENNEDNLLNIYINKVEISKYYDCSRISFTFSELRALSSLWDIVG